MGTDETDPLDRLSDAEISALADDLLGLGSRGRGSGGPRSARIRNELAEGAKHPKRYADRRILDKLEGTGLNQTITIEIELPAYYVAGMNRYGREGYREAVRDFLTKKGETWWQPRFMAAIKAKQIEAAFKRSQWLE